MTDALTDPSAAPPADPAPDDPGAVGHPASEALPPDPPPPPPPARLLGLTAEGWATLVVVAGCAVFTFANLGPGNIVADTTPAGGDMGAHVWGPAYLRDHLLPSGRLTGWTQDWYNGFPAYHFYMVVPSLAIALLSLVLPYGVAFKLVAVSGVVTLPISAWAFGRLTRLPFPIPPLLAVGGTAFLFDRSFSIYGGNIASTLAGEFAFSISLSLAVLYLGVVGNGLRTGRHRGWAALLLALTALCHLIPAIFALAGTAVWFLVTLSWGRLRPTLAAGLLAVSAGLALVVFSLTTVWDEFPHDGVRLAVLWAVAALVLLVPAVMVAEFPRARLWYLASATVVGSALTAFWTLPFYLRSGYMNDMGWEKKRGADFANYLFSRERLDPQLVDALPIKYVLAVAAVGALMAIVYGITERNRAGIFWVAVAAVFAAAFVLAPQGRLWNARLLPFYYLALYLLAAIGIGYVGRTLASLVARDPDRPVRPVNLGTLVVATVATLLALAVPLRALPDSLGPIDLVQDRSDGKYQWAFLPPTSDNSFVDSWARWNFEGYERKPAYPEYHDIVATMAALGQERGCGRAMWEHEEQHDRYGTPMALMLLPFWTDGCIGSQEGLYFEASSTTPYHFINQDELSAAPSNAQRDLPYGPGAPSRTDFDRGIDHLQMLGVRYYMAISDRMIDFARRNDSLTEVAASGPWVVFEVADSDLVVPLANRPAVVTGIEDEAHGWLDMSVDWYTDPEAWDVFLAAGGPADWQRVAEGETPEVVPERAVTVSDVETGDDRISFRVSEPGVPVLVRASYFPNWQADGAEGPWRITPNLMVVVPTDTTVTLTYGWTVVDVGGWAVALAGLVGLVWLFRAPPLVMPEPPPRPRRRPVAPDGGPDDADSEPDGARPEPDAEPASEPAGASP